MRKIIFICFVCFGNWAQLRAQQDPHFTQYMLVKSYASPALTAHDNKGSVSLLSRAQWIGYETTYENEGGAPSTQFLSFSTPLQLKNLQLGLGANILYDKVGPINTIETQFSIAYHKTLNRGVLSFGVRPSLINQTLNTSSLRFVDPVGEPFNTQRKESQTVVDMGFGVSYSTEEFVLAGGVSHLLQPVMNYGIDGSNDSGKKTSMIYSLYAEYNYRLTYNVDLTPSILVTSDINTYSIDVSAIATYNKKIWAGLSYRNNEAMALLMGYSFFDDNQLKAGYSFDYVIKEQSAKQPTSHEIFIRYNLPSISTGAKKIIRTPRFRY